MAVTGIVRLINKQSTHKLSQKNKEYSFLSSKLNMTKIKAGL
jgi:hypothetical protein